VTNLAESHQSVVTFYTHALAELNQDNEDKSLQIVSLEVELAKVRTELEAVKSQYEAVMNRGVIRGPDD
jgi:chaperonin cofactor prefoldin